MPLEASGNAVVNFCFCFFGGVGPGRVPGIIPKSPEATQHPPKFKGYFSKASFLICQVGDSNARVLLFWERTDHTSGQMAEGKENLRSIVCQRMGGKGVSRYMAMRSAESPEINWTRGN